MTNTVKKSSKAKQPAKKASVPDDDEDEIRLVRFDDTAVVVGGFAHLRLIAWDDPIGVLACSVLHTTGVLELGAGTPVVRPLLEEWTQACGRARDLRWAMLHGLWKKTRPIRVYSASLDPVTAIELQPARKAEFAGIGFVGARVIAIPGYLGPDRRSLYPGARQPFLQDEKKLVPAPGLAPGDEGGASQLTGVVACSDGRDVVVWGGRMFELAGERFVRTHDFDLEITHSAGLTAVTHGTNGFFTISNGRLVEILPGANKPKMVLPKETFLSVHPGPGATMFLVATYRTAEKSALWVYDPDTSKARPVVPPKDVVRSTPLFYVSARNALARLAGNNDGTAGQSVMLERLQKPGLA